MLIQPSEKEINLIKNFHDFLENNKQCSLADFYETANIPEEDQIPLFRALDLMTKIFKIGELK